MTKEYVWYYPHLNKVYVHNFEYTMALLTLKSAKKFLKQDFYLVLLGIL